MRQRKNIQWQIGEVFDNAGDGHTYFHHATGVDDKYNHYTGVAVMVDDHFEEMEDVMPANPTYTGPEHVFKTFAFYNKWLKELTEYEKSTLIEMLKEASVSMWPEAGSNVDTLIRNNKKLRNQIVKNNAMLENVKWYTPDELEVIAAKQVNTTSVSYEHGFIRGFRQGGIFVQTIREFPPVGGQADAGESPSTSVIKKLEDDLSFAVKQIKILKDEADYKDEEIENLKEALRGKIKIASTWAKKCMEACDDRRKLQGLLAKQNQVWIVGSDMICPATGNHCDDECCPEGAICNLKPRTPPTGRNATPEEQKEYTRAQLVQFGNYILSPERRKLYEQEGNQSLIEERLSQVNHADVENFNWTIEIGNIKSKP